jgi:uncharacterized OB-fold protein
MRRADPPFVMAYVTLAEGPTMMTNIVNCDPATLQVGAAVEVIFVRSEGGFAVPCFQPKPLKERPSVAACRSIARLVT